MTYTEIKQALRKETSDSLRHFTKSFFATYIAAVRQGAEYDEQGIDDTYHDGEIWTRHRWDAVRKTDFYVKSSCAYCEFLRIAARTLDTEVRAQAANL